MGGKLVAVQGAVMMCTSGSLPAPLLPSCRTARIAGQWVGNINDHVPIVNIPPFGMCSITQSICVPVTITQWSPVLGTVKLWQPVPVLSEGAMNVCLRGGLIAVITAGQPHFAIANPPRDRNMCRALPPGGAAGGRGGGGGGACGADAGWGNACGADYSACAVNVGVGNACGAAASGCGANASGGTACGAAVSACGAAASGASACGAAVSACGAAASGATACGAAASVCGADASGLEACGVQSVCAVDVCGADACALDLAVAEILPFDACLVDVTPLPLI